MKDMIQVRYPNRQQGPVDDVTLDELIAAKKILEFFRPSEDRWVDLGKASPRRGRQHYRGPERRTSTPPGSVDEKKGFLQRFLPHSGSGPARRPGANDWYEEGFMLLFSRRDYPAAVRAYASCIRIDPTYARAYLHRGIGYEKLGNLQQSVEDYSKIIEVHPGDAKAYHLRGLVYRRLGREAEALADLTAAAAMGYRLSAELLKSEGFTRGKIAASN